MSRLNALHHSFPGPSHPLDRFEFRMRGKAALVASCLALAALHGCGGPPAASETGTRAGSAPTTSPTAVDVSCPAFAVTGDATTAGGARWSYTSTDSGEPIALEGVLFAPQGPGPFPAAVVSHGAGGLPSNYSASIARTMLSWGLVVIATRHTHAADPDGRNAALLPAGADGASEANVRRARKTRDLLSCLGSVDMARIAAHGHSMGAFAACAPRVRIGRGWQALPYNRVGSIRSLDG